MRAMMEDGTMIARYLRVVVGVLALAVLSACANGENPFGMGNRETIGTAGGAAGGALIGGIFGDTKGAIIGGLLGGVIGNRVGAMLDKREQERLAAAAQAAAAQNKKVAWSSPGPSGETTASGWVTPKKTYTASNGQTCRVVTQTATKNGQTQSEDVTLCKTAQNGETRWVTPT